MIILNLGPNFKRDLTIVVNSLYNVLTIIHGKNCKTNKFEVFISLITAMRFIRQYILMKLVTLIKTFTL